MKISAKAEYACLAIMALARLSPDQTPIRIREIAVSHAIPERYLVQILLQLKGAGLVFSARGSSGGYRLARPPDRISLGEVLSAIDGPGEPLREASGAAGQALASVWETHPRGRARGALPHVDRATRRQLDAPRVGHLRRIGRIDGSDGRAVLFGGGVAWV